IIVALFFGLKAAVLAIVVEAVVRISRRALKNQVLIGLAAAAFLGIFFLNIPFPIIIFAAALIGFIGGMTGVAAFQGGGGGPGPAETARGRPRGGNPFGGELPRPPRPPLARALKSAGGWVSPRRLSLARHLCASL